MINLMTEQVRKPCKKCGNDHWSTGIENGITYYICNRCEHKLKKDTRRKPTLADKVLANTDAVNEFFESIGAKRFDTDNDIELQLLSNWAEAALKRLVDGKKLKGWDDDRLVRIQLNDCHKKFAK